MAARQRIWRSAFGLVFLLTLVFATMSCAAQYNLLFGNGSSHTIRDAEVSYGDYRFGGNEWKPGAGAMEGLVPFPLPKKATVTWRAEDGTKHSKTIEVRSRLPRRFKGDLSFKILDDGEVSFSYETWAEQDARRAEKLRENPPIFEEGELEVETVVAGEGPRTKGLGKWNHPELEALPGLQDGWEVLVELATRIKTKGAYYAPGQRVEIEGQTVCFSEGEEGRLLVTPCAD